MADDDLTTQIDKWAREQQDASPAAQFAASQDEAAQSAANLTDPQAPIDPRQQLLAGNSGAPPSATSAKVMGADGQEHTVDLKTGADVVVPANASPVITGKPQAMAPADAQPATVQQGPAAQFANPYANQIQAAQDAQEGLNNQGIDLKLAAQNRAEALSGVNAEQQRYAAQAADMQTAAEKQAGELEAKHKALVEHEGARNFQKEYWKKQGPAKTIMSVIAATIGGFAQGWTHAATNPGTVAVDKSIDQYVKESEEKSQLKINSSNDLFQHFLMQTKSRETASALTHSSLLEGAKAKLEEAAGQEHDVEARGHLAEQSRALDGQIAFWRDRAKQDELRAKQGGAPLTVQQLVALRKENAEAAKVEAETSKITSESSGKPAVQAAANNAAGGKELGFVDRFLAPTALDPESSFSGAAKAVIGTEGQDKLNRILDYTAEEMKSKGLPMRGNAVIDYANRHGYLKHPELIQESAQRVGKNPIIADAERESKGAADYKGAEEQ
jgi:hypothetical protein